jgi:hypothetical protein
VDRGGGWERGWNIGQLTRGGTFLPGLAPSSTGRVARESIRLRRGRAWRELNGPERSEDVYEQASRVLMVDDLQDGSMLGNR